jgi:hypothetical protein
MSAADAYRRRVLEAQAIEVSKPLETERAKVAPTAIGNEGVGDGDRVTDP